MPIAAILSISDNGIGYQWFTDHGKRRHEGSIQWDTIAAVDVFKRDMFTWDLICAQISGKEQEPIEFDEEDPHWGNLVTALSSRLSGCETWAEWFSEVAFPAFEMKARRIFERK